MTQKRAEAYVFAGLLILGVSTAWGEVKKESSAELLPAPKCCCEQATSSNHGCCATTAASPCCDKEKLEDGAVARGRVVNRIYAVGRLLWPAELVILPIGDQELFLGWASQTPNGPRLQEDSPEEELINLIRNTVQPESWCDVGGLGTIDYFPTTQSLVVHQTPDIQEQIADLLAVLGRVQEQQNSVPPVSSMLVPSPALVPPLPPGVPLNGVPPMPPLFTERVPPPHLLASSPVAPPYPYPGIMSLTGLSPAPSVQPTPAQETYVLEATMMEVQPNGKAVSCNKDIVEFRPDPHSLCNLITGWEAGKGYREWLLMVKATHLKNEGLRLEVVNVEGKADPAGDGKVALELHATPVLNRKVKPGEAVKKVLEKDEHGKPRKWLELTVKQLPPAPIGAIYPSPAEAATPAPVPTGMLPMPCLAAPLAFQPVCPGIFAEPVPPLRLGIPPSSGAMPRVAEARPAWLMRQSEEDSSWNLRPIVEQGKPKLIVREGDRDSVTVKSLVVKIPGNDALKLTAAGTQIRAQSGSLQAHADKVSRTGEAGCFVFEGHVKLTYKKDGERARVIAERVFVNLADGCIEVQDAAVVCPAPPLSTVENEVEIKDYRVAVGAGLRIVVPMMGPLPIALDVGFPIVRGPDDHEHVFSFWVGFFH